MMTIYNQELDVTKDSRYQYNANTKTLNNEQFSYKVEYLRVMAKTKTSISKLNIWKIRRKRHLIRKK